MLESSPMPSRDRRAGRSAWLKRIAFLLSTQSLFLNNASSAEPARVLVVPVGEQDALVPTVRVARAIEKQLNKEGQTEARLAYLMPRDVAAGAAQQPSDLARAEKELEQATEAFQALDFEAVRHHAAIALEVYRASIAAGGSSKGYVEALHLLAATELFDGRQEAAFRAMSDAVIFSERSPSQRKFNPTVQQFHRKVLEDKEYRGRLEPEAMPDALIWLDGRLTGATGEAIEVRAGLHWVVIARPGYSAWRDWVRVEPAATRGVKVALERAAIREAMPVIALRQSIDRPVPSPTVQQLLQQSRWANQMILVSSRSVCLPQNCAIVLSWAVGGQWKRRAAANFAGNASGTASTLLRGPLIAGAGATGQICAGDSECPLDARCRDGVCRRHEPITRKWWFWTAIAAAAAGVAAAVAIPLLLPDAPVIEVN